MFSNLTELDSIRLSGTDYRDDFYRHYYSGNVSHLRKLERGQHFEEPGNPSWEKFIEGDWSGSLELIEEERRPKYVRELASQAHPVLRQRLRVVELPFLTPYIQWEMYVLRLRNELGDEIRVLDASLISYLESRQKVPELVIRDESVMYEVLYDSKGNLDGAHRYDDPTLVREKAEEFDVLLGQGEGFGEFFSREILTLPEPILV